MEAGQPDWLIDSPKACPGMKTSRMLETVLLFDQGSRTGPGADTTTMHFALAAQTCSTSSSWSAALPFVPAAAGGNRNATVLRTMLRLRARSWLSAVRLRKANDDEISLRLIHCHRY